MTMLDHDLRRCRVGVVGRACKDSSPGGQRFVLSTCSCAPFDAQLLRAADNDHAAV